MESQLPSIDDFIDQQGQDSFAEILSLLDMHGIGYTRNKSLVRGLDYYNGTCFEIKTISEEAEKVLGKSQNTLVAGGRYDYLANVYTKGKYHIPSIGWAAGIDRLVILLDSLASQEESTNTKPFIGITTIVPKHESQEGHGKLIREKCFLLKKALEGQLRESGVEVQLDLREKLKLNERLNILMSPKASKGVIVIGLTEAEKLSDLSDIDELEVSIKREGQTENTICKISDISNHI